MINSFYSEKELSEIGFKKYGQNILISRNAKFYKPEKMTIGNNVRIDDFCLLSGLIELGNYIHISAYTALYGRFGIEINDFSGLSPRCTVFSASDDFSGDYLIGPMVEEKLTNVIGGKVIIGKYSQLGCNCVVLPAVTIGDGVAVGAMSLVRTDLEPWSVYAGNPIRLINIRKQGLLKLIGKNAGKY